MKKYFILFVWLIPGIAFSQNNVGINKPEPEATLDVRGGRWNLEGGDQGDVRIGNTIYNLNIGVATGGGGAGISRIFANGGQNRLIFGTDSTDRVYINNLGNMGIGVSNPTERLHINGSFKVSDLSGSGDRNVIVDSGGKLKIGTVGVGDSDWVENGNFVYNFNKSVGIGTSAPNTKLHVINAVDPNGHIQLTVPNSGQFDLFGHTMTLGGNFINVGGNLVKSLNLQNTSNGNIFMVQGGGNVGIATVDPPTAKLTVEGVDNDGEFGALEIRTVGSAQRMILDGNEIDVADGSRLFINANHQSPVSIGTHQWGIGYMLNVDGKILAEEVRVQLSTDWPDYVFSPEYNLMPLTEVAKEIKKQGHLPGIPAAHQIEKEGLDVGDMQKRMMEKIEELTLYLIEQQKEIDRLKALIK